jgi:hypothetical protein
MIMYSTDPLPVTVSVLDPIDVNICAVQLVPVSV